MKKIEVYSGREANLDKLEEALEVGKNVVVTHNGPQHGDEVTAVALSDMTNDSDTVVFRTRDNELIETAREGGAFIVDVGQQFDGEKNFDHHH